MNTTRVWPYDSVSPLPPAAVDEDPHGLESEIEVAVHTPSRDEAAGAELNRARTVWPCDPVPPLKPAAVEADGQPRQPRPDLGAAALAVMAASVHPTPQWHVRLKRSFLHLNEIEARRCGLAFGVIPAPQLRYSLLWTALACISLSVSFVIPFALNERHIRSVVLRGLTCGALASHVVLPIFVINAAIVVRGTLHRRFFLAGALAIGTAMICSTISMRSMYLGVISITLTSIGVSFILSVLILNTPLFWSKEHATLDRNFGPPLFLVIIGFFLSFLG